MRASVAGNMECVKVLLDRGAEVNMQHKVSGISLYSVCQGFTTRSHYTTARGYHSSRDTLVNTPECTLTTAV